MSNATDLLFSVVLATFNRRLVLERTLASVFNQNFPADQFEVIVAVDGSTDGTQDFLAKLNPPCKFRYLDLPHGERSRARNAALAQARGKIILFLDDDIVCEPNVLQAHADAHHEENPCVVFGRVMVESGSKPGIATQWTVEDVRRLNARWMAEKQPRWPRDISVDPNCSVPRTAIVAVGGFDEEFYRTREDADLGLRLHQNGLPFKFCAEAIVHQIFVKSSAEVILRDSYFNGQNEVLLSRKHPDYRPHSWLAHLNDGSLWKRLARNAVVRLPFSLEPFLRPLFWIAELLFRRGIGSDTGIRLLQFRSAIIFLRSAAKKAGSWQQYKKEFGMQLPVLLYHGVGLPREGTYPGLSVSSNRFRQQMKWLKDWGYSTITAEQWLAWRNTGRRLPEKPVLITFDDAYAENTRTVLPILQGFGFRATVFVPTGSVGGHNWWDTRNGWATIPLMSRDEIQDTSNTFEFGSHGRAHVDLTTVGCEERRVELEESKRELSAITGTAVCAIAYPYGEFNPLVADTTTHHYDLAFTTEPGLNRLSTPAMSHYRSDITERDGRLDLWLILHFGRSQWQELLGRIQLRTRVRRLYRLTVLKFTNS